MPKSIFCTGVCAVLLFVLLLQQLLGTISPQVSGESRHRAVKLLKNGNYAEALEVFRKLIEDSDNGGQFTADDLSNAVNCLQHLNRVNEFDQLVETAIEIHNNDWQLLLTAGQLFGEAIDHHGFVIGGQFERGEHRGNGQYASSEARDRVRSIQLLLKTLAALEQAEDATPEAKANVWGLLANITGQERLSQPWKLQDLTDLTVLPGYQNLSGNHHFESYGHSPPDAPVDEEGDPVLFHVPNSWETGSSDGERWRWAMAQQVLLAPNRQSAVDLEWARFLVRQFGVRSTTHQLAPVTRTTGDRSVAGFTLHQLDDTETLARLAIGERRLSLPEEFNHIAVIQRVIDRKDSQQKQAIDMMIQVRMNRHQYPQAAALLRNALELTRQPKVRSQLRKRIRQIEDNQIQFETARTQSAGQGAVLDIRFRNGSQASFTARPIDIEQLLSDTREYLEDRPAQLDHNRIQIQNVGYRLINDNRSKYLGKPVASWELDLTPKEGHFDVQESVTTPLKKAGAYWVEATIRDGNTSRIVLWIADTSITKKHIEDGTLYFVADAATGAPADRAGMEFFGFRQKRIGRTRNHHVITRRFTDRTDGNGLCVVAPEQHSRMRWVTVARTDAGGLAFDGFSRFWKAQPLHELHDSPVKVYVVTDRPVYRPEHEVKFRMWIRQPRFHEKEARYAHTSFVLQVYNPRGDVTEERSVTTDRWGGIDGTWPVPADAVPGSYTLAICRNDNRSNKPAIGSGDFQVEEYRKPEFEVSIDAPDEPVKPGETISAVINARYYFGAPVSNGRVRYRIERTTQDNRWFPKTQWDWLFSPGYWWFPPDSAWYPGWHQWGCFGPTPRWSGWSFDPPEVVAEGDAAIGADGTLAVKIDTESARQHHSDSDHLYRITAEVMDQSRRTIFAEGDVLVARKPFKVFVWTDRGHYQTGDTVTVNLQARTSDGRRVEGPVTGRLLQVTWNGNDAEEREVETFDIATGEDGSTSFKAVIPQAGQYRVSCSVTDVEGTTLEGGQLLYVRGPGDAQRGYRFNDLELIVEKRDYQPGETAVIQINTNLPDSTVLLFVRPVNGVCPQPEVIRLKGKSTTYNLKIRPEDMPNIYVEALTIANGRLHSAMKQIFVPPVQKVAEVEVVASQKEYRPGESAEVTVKLRDESGRPFVGNAILTAYDASLEYIAASTSQEIRKFFWNIRRQHQSRVTSTLQRISVPLFRKGDRPMQPLSGGSPTPIMPLGNTGGRVLRSSRMEEKESPGSPMAMADDGLSADSTASVEPTVRSVFTDTALWLASVDSNADGLITAQFDLPDNLTTWKIKVWTLGRGTRVGSGTTDIICSRKLIIRPQSPRFFTQKDQITLSAIVHNDLNTAKDVDVVLETEGGQLRHLTTSTQTVKIEPGGEARVDWPVQVVASGNAVVRMKALTNEESDAVELTVPAQIHGILKTESFAGAIRPGQDSAQLQLHVPARRIEQQSRLEIRYSPSLAGTMVDALPYLIEYPYGCTEQTLNRFLPAVLTQRTLVNMGLDLEAIRIKRTNLNAQEIINSAKSKQRWNTRNPNPVFDTDEMNRIVRNGVQALTDMQLSDGGWGWFSGYGEHSSPHLTALVVHGLSVAQVNDVPVLPDVINRGVLWLKSYQAAELVKLQEGDRRREFRESPNGSRRSFRMQAGNMDALVAWVLSEHNGNNPAMTDYLDRDRLQLSVYGMCLTGLVLHSQSSNDRRDIILRNVEQYLQRDDENQTAWLRLPGSRRWYWYGNENETHAMYLRLLLKVRPKDITAPRVVKYLLNNRRTDGHWGSTRDTAVVIESMAEYIDATGEDRPDMTVEVSIDGQLHKRVRINAENFFSFDNMMLLEGDTVHTGARNIEIRRTGTGPVYFNAYLTFFTQEDPVTAAGLEVKVRRQFYRLERNDDQVSVRGDRGQSVRQRTTRWKRIPLANFDQVKSGELVEVELLIDSKNDYEYLLLEDHKPSGFEPDDRRSGYVNSGLRAYRELRDDRVSFFISRLARGNHSINYRLRAETPGRMSALPARIKGMYAPELVGNSNEFKLQVTEAVK
ncbi:MAG: MG2 domain-containing protein [Fuerstiella sp.]|nr:MG2 domain-containing protein [Fuerstiella sp.]